MKLSLKQVQAIKRLCRSVPQIRLAERFDVTRATISRIVSGECWPLASRSIYPRTKDLTQKKVSEIKRLHAEGRSMRSLSMRFDVGRHTVKNIVVGLSYD